MFSTPFINDIDLMIFSQLVARPYTQPDSTLLIRFSRKVNCRLLFHADIASSSFPNQCYRFDVFRRAFNSFNSKILPSVSQIWKFILCCWVFRNFPRIVYTLVGRGQIRNRGIIWPKRFIHSFFVPASNI